MAADAEQIEGLLDRRHFREAFDTEAYLSDFYERLEDAAMRVVLAFLPNVAARLPKSGLRVLDVGAGPTIHVAVCFRHSASEIFLADYLPQNRAELLRWCRSENKFNWERTVKYIALQEGESTESWTTIEADARRKVRGILACDVHRCPVIPKSPRHLDGFDVVTTIFCIEFTCRTLEEFAAAVSNAAAAVREGGRFVMGAILDSTWCAFGGRRFACCCVAEHDLLDALRRARLAVDAPDFHFLNCDGVALASARKIPADHAAPPVA